MNTQNTNTQITRNMIMNDFCFQEFCMIRNLKPQSAKAYLSPLRLYVEINNATLSDLIEEADMEEEQHIRTSKTKLRRRLLHYKQYLQNNNYNNTTINSYLTQVKTIYRTFDISIPDIPRNKTRKPSYKEIIKKEDIITALNTCTNIKHKAIILFMSSSGTGAGETCTLTIQDFIDATSEYHNEIRIEQVIQVLKKRNDIIPTWHITRLKTGVPYFTFSSPESVNALLVYLQELVLKKQVCNEDLLFGMKSHSVAVFFEKLNDRCGFGWVNNTRRFFHSHGLRKFFATNMLSEGVSELVIDFWEGRTVSGTHSVYFNPSPEQLKRRYMNALNCVTIFEGVSYHDINSEEKLELERLREMESERDVKLQRLQEIVDEYVLRKTG